MHFASVIIFSAGEILSDCVLCSSGVFFFLKQNHVHNLHKESE